VLCVCGCVYALRPVKEALYNVISPLCHSISKLAKKKHDCKHDSQRLLLDMDQEFPIGTSTVHNRRIERLWHNVFVIRYVVFINANDEFYLILIIIDHSEIE
jgi:hypothetical protein